MRTALRDTHRRRLTSVAAALAVGALTLTACGQADNVQGSSDDGDSASSDEEVSLRFAWWGSDHYHAMYQEVADAFMAEHPDIEIVAEFTDWGGYWDKLATTVAAGDTPDVLMQEQRYLREYAERGVLADMSELDIDTSAMDPGTLATGEVEDGLYAIPTGVNVFSVLANTKVFADAGVELPDDTTWTWDDYKDVADAISASGTGLVGRQDLWNDAAFNVFARQQGESLFTEDGKLGVTKDKLAQYWTNLLALQSSKATPTAEFTSQDMNAPLDQGGMATGKLAMSYAWSNQLNALSKASGQELKLLRLPSVSGKATENGSYYKGSMFWSISSRSKHPKEAAKFVSYLANSTAAGDVLLAERGVPPNTELRAAVGPKLKPADAASLAFIQGIAKELGEPSPPPPVGGGQVEKIIQRYTTEVMFGRQQPAQAAKAFIDEVNGELK